MLQFLSSVANPLHVVLLKPGVLFLVVSKLMLKLHAMIAEWWN